MRIGLVRRGYSSTGGAESYLRRLAAGLGEAGHGCVLFGGRAWPAVEWTGTEFQRIPGADTPRAFAARVAQAAAARGCDLLFSLERLERCDCYRAGDGVHRAWLARRARAEPAWKSRLRAWHPKHRQILALEAALFAGGGARAVIANSQMVRDEIVEHYAYPPERIAVVRNGLPAEYFAAARPQVPEPRSAARAALGLREDDCALLFAGSGWERKGLRHALAALEILIAAEAGGRAAEGRPVLLVAGRGDPKPHLKNLSFAARERTRFLGPVNDMANCYAAADVFVLPTLYDPFSNACLEALAAGLPVVTTRANGFAEIITPGVDGEIVDEQRPGFDAALADALAGWLDPARRELSGESCRRKASGHTIAGNVRDTLDFLRRAGLMS